MIANVTVGTGPDMITYDAVNNFMYVIDSNTPGLANVSIISGTTVVGTINKIGSGFYNNPVTMIYNPSNHYMYVANSFTNSVSVISGTQLVANISTGTVRTL